MSVVIPPPLLHTEVRRGTTAVHHAAIDSAARKDVEAGLGRYADAQQLPSLPHIPLA